MLPPETYKDKVVLVTGGGTGLGKGMSLKFSHLGAKVAIASRRMNVLEDAAKEITAATGNTVLPVQLDVRDPAAVAKAIDQIEAELGLPNVVINNAAGNFISPTERLSANAFQTIIDIVLKGSAFLTLDVGKRMIKQKKGGVFLAITTHYTNEGSGFVVPSACAKSGVETMCKSLGVEWGRYGIRFNCIAPGPIETEGAFGNLDPTGQSIAMLALPTFAATAFSGPAPMVAPRLAGASSVSMRAEGEIGVTPPLGVYDPLNLLATPVVYPRRSYERYVELEIKHGRIAMLACLGVITTEAGIRWPGYLSKSLDLKFEDIPGGALDSYAAVPAIGWLQIVSFIVILELGYGATPPGNAPGDVGGPSWIRYDDPAVKTFKLNAERNNGRAAMMGIIGMMIHESLTGNPIWPLAYEPGKFPLIPFEGGIFA